MLEETQGSKIKRFEDLIVWQKARELTREIYRCSNKGGLAKDYALKDQLRRSAISVMSNIAEGFERGGRAEFHQFLVIAKGSCAELRSQLYAALDAGYIGQEEFELLHSLAEEVARLLGGLRAAVGKKRRTRG